MIITPTEYEYLLMIEPRPLMKTINGFKDRFREYGFPNVFITPAHITLLHFLRTEEHEKQIMKKFNQMAESTRPFEIRMYGFGDFRSTTSTIYIRIKNPDPVLDLVARRKKEVNEVVKGSKTMYPGYDETPHITIARGLTNEQMEEVWPEWRREYVEEAFTATEMLLLRRRYNGDRKQKNDVYREVARFPFLGKTPPPQPVQMGLFD